LSVNRRPGVVELAPSKIHSRWLSWTHSTHKANVFTSTGTVRIL